MNRKPIIQCKDNCTNTYKNCFIAYALNASIEFVTDLNSDEFENLLNGKYTIEDIICFETIGRFTEIFDKKKDLLEQAN